MKTKKIILCVISIGMIVFLVNFRMHEVEERTEEVFFSIAQIMHVNQQDKILLVKGIGENNPIGEEGYVYCEENLLWRLENEELVQSTFNDLSIGDSILLEYGRVLETYPTKLHAIAILSIESKIYPSSSNNYSVTYFQKGSVMREWKNIKDAQYGLIRSLMYKWITTSSAREGKDLSNLSEYYIIKEIDEKGETREFILYKMEDEAYIQWGEVTEFIGYNMIGPLYTQLEKTAQWGQCMPIDNRLYNLLEQLFP